MNINELLDKKHAFAIIGASNNLEKYGSRIYLALRDKGFTVYPVNNKDQYVHNDKAYTSVADLPPKVDVLNFVIPPEIALQITQSAYELGYKIFWYQPGSFDSKILEFHHGKDTIVISDQCLLIESQKY